MSAPTPPRTTRPDGLARLDDLTERLRALDGVESVAPQPDRTPPRATVTLTESSIPPAAQDILDDPKINAEIDKPLTTPDGALQFDAVLGTRWRPAGIRKVFSHGNSVAVTLTREALDTAGFEIEDKIIEEASDGEIRISLHEEA